MLVKLFHPPILPRMGYQPFSTETDTVLFSDHDRAVDAARTALSRNQPEQALQYFTAALDAYASQATVAGVAREAGYLVKSDKTILLGADYYLLAARYMRDDNNKHDYLRKACQALQAIEKQYPQDFADNAAIIKRVAAIEQLAGMGTMNAILTKAPAINLRGAAAARLADDDAECFGVSHRIVAVRMLLDGNIEQAEAMYAAGVKPSRGRQLCGRLVVHRYLPN